MMVHAEPELIIEDFEGGTYGSWTAEGAAFGTAPARANVAPPNNRVAGYQGTGLVSTYLGGDGATGTLTSPEFTIERKHINFLIGAGNYDGKTCMNLLIDGNVVRTAAGWAQKIDGNEILDWKSWDVEEFIGQKATLQIVDSSTGRWGHVNVDHIVQSDAPRNPVYEFMEEKQMPEDFASKVPKYVFADTLEEQEAQLADNPLLERFRVSRKKILTDPHHPLYHFTSPENALNDPNGLSFWKGNWHLFYQGYPPEDSRQHWGHAVSDDLIHWRDLPYAIYPDPERACYSGAAFVEDDRVIAMYYGTTVGCMIAVSDDPLLLNWEKLTGRAVIPHARPGEPALPYNIFDPCIWKQGDCYYALTAGQSDDGPGGRRVREEFLHRSKDLVTWEYLHPFLENDRYGEIGDDGACPYFWPIGDKHILLHFSHMTGGKYLLGDYDTDRDKFVITDGGDFNFGAFGPCGIHAPSAFPDGKGGVIAIFNVNEGKRSPGWNRMMSLPRRLTLREGGFLNPLNIEPAGEVESLRGDHVQVGAMDLPANREVVLDSVQGGALEIMAEFEPQKGQTLELNVLRSADGEEVTRIQCFRDRGYRVRGTKALPAVVSIDSAHSTLDDVLCRPPETAQVELDADEPLKLRVFIDRSIVEVFINGRQCVSARVYPVREDSIGVSLRSMGRDAKLKSLDAWQMKSIYE
jgi:beta-fructofuranosidase